MQELGNIAITNFCPPICFNLKNAAGSCILTSNDMTLAVGMAAKITRGRNPKTMKLYF